MRLSDAIRLGAMLKPQAFDQAGDGATCALQAAAEAIGVPAREWGNLSWEVWPWLATLFVACPQCVEHGTAPVEMIIWLLNDTHQWTREQIADFVESLEAAQAHERSNHEDFACCSPSSAAQSVRERA